jgi:transcriptional regulator with XRE-family HTH domain
MEHAGSKLKQVREKLGLKYRDVERASQEIAERRQNDEFAIALSRLADIENKGTVPTIFRLFSLCAIYRLDYQEALRWYGVPVEDVAAEALRIPHELTHAIRTNSAGPFLVPTAAEREIDFTKTTFLGQFLKRWGKNGLGFLNGHETRDRRYGFIGLGDWSMHPVLHPGSLVLIDEGRRRIATAGWSSELDRPIYFVEHRAGYRCGWCSRKGDSLVMQAHPSSQIHPEIFPMSEVDVLGQVTGVAMLFESTKRRPARSEASPAMFPDR